MNISRCYNIAGDSTIGWIERYVRVYDLEIVRRVVVIHHSTYGYKEIGGTRIDVSIMMIRLCSNEQNYIRFLS